MKKNIYHKILNTLIVFAFIASDIFAFITPVQAQQDLAFENENLYLVSTDSEGFTLELSTQDFLFEQSVVDGQPCQRLIAENYGSMGKRGWPNLPVQGAVLGIPLDSEPSLTVLDAESVLIPGSYNICPTEIVLPDEDLLGVLPKGFQPLIWDPQAYTQTIFTPETPIEMTSPAFLRSQRVVQVRFQPFQYNPSSGELRYYPKIKVKINMPVDMSSVQSSENTFDEGTFEDILRNSLLNYEMARQWRQQPDDSFFSTQFMEINSPTLGSSTFKLYTKKEGIYQVTYEDLSDMGVDLSNLNTDTLQLFNQWQEVPVCIYDGGDHQFDPGDFILFYGEEINTKYTNQNVYFLTWNIADGLRMPAMDGSVIGGSNLSSSFQQILRLEEDLFYMPSLPSGADKDTWYWDFVDASNAPASRDFGFQLDNVVSTPSMDATVRGLLKGDYYAYPHHRTKIYINGNLIDDATWDVDAEYNFEINFSQTYLVNGTNTLTIECPLGNGVVFDTVWINWFEIEYQSAFAASENSLVFQNRVDASNEFEVMGFITNTIEVFDITDPTSVQQVVNSTIQPSGATYNLVFETKQQGTRRYIALSSSNFLTPSKILRDNPSNLHDVSNGADYIVITHKDFSSALQPLMDHRAAQGLRTFLVDVEDIYDEFNGGILDANAIRDFLAYTYENWQSPAPMYVLLVGGGSFDPKNNLGIGDYNYVLAYLDQVDTLLGETASDNRFVAVSGDDFLPDMYIGRLPVQTSIEATIAVTKILNYEQNSVLEDWKQRVLLVADNPEEYYNYPNYSDMLASTIPNHIGTDKIYLGVTHTDADEAKTGIIDAFNQGYLLVNYTGNGFFQNWAEENLFDKTAISSIHNENKLPIVISTAPFNGYFLYHYSPSGGPESLAESLINNSPSGAVAVLATTGLGNISTQNSFNQEMFAQIFANPETRLGAAALQAKLNLQLNANGQELIDTLTLFGDPAMVISIPQQFQVFLPMVIQSGG
jgi:hypothetical protein